MTKHAAYLVLNAGSSSLKFSVLRQLAASAELQTVLSGQIAGIGNLATFEARDARRNLLGQHQWSAADSARRDVLLQYLLTWVGANLSADQIVAAGHRVVHGGQFLRQPMRVDAALLAQLEQLIPLAPLHQPHNLEPMQILARLYPELVQVACFDTAFHASMPWRAKTYALPRQLIDEGICKYGFHGLSYEYVSQQLLAQRPELAAKRSVICHLGNGSSLCAVHNGRSMDTSMGFTALDGVPMGSRSGSIDPGVLLYLMREKKLDLATLEDLLYRRSGLLGVSGLSNDMQVLQQSNNPQARQAVELFCFCVAKAVAGMAASMGGLDALVFTAGIGENSPAIRALIAQQLQWLGVAVDDAANSQGQFDISAAGARVASLVVATNEEMMIAQHIRRLLAAG